MNTIETPTTDRMTGANGMVGKNLSKKFERALRVISRFDENKITGANWPEAGRAMIDIARAALA